MNPPSNPPLSIYIHWPYCSKKCPYCDFNVHRETAPIDVATWQRAYLRDLDYHHARSCRHRLTSLFFGGGTPSRMPPALTQSIIDHCLKRWHSSPSIEISLEVNPSDSPAIPTYVACGVNRLSIGGQSLIASRLAFLGRDHSPDDVRAAIDTAHQHAPYVSADFISCLPFDTPTSWQQELLQIATLPLGHLSIYGLTIEPHTPFHRAVQQKVWHPPNQDQQALFYQQTQTTLTDNGFHPYEVSSYARTPNHQCRHNLTYWRYGNYLGIGPGSHGRLHHNGTTHAWQNHKKPQDWLHHCLNGKNGIDHQTPLRIDEQISEMLLMGLRLKQGIDTRTISHITNRPLSDFLDPHHVRLCIDAHWLEHPTSHSLRLTDEGLLRLDSIVELITTRHHSAVVSGSPAPVAPSVVPSAVPSVKVLTAAAVPPSKDERPRPTTSSAPFCT